MKRMKKVTISVLLGVILVMQGMIIHAAEGCAHDWCIDKIEEVFSDEKSCNKHGVYCRVYITGYNVVEFCSKCKDRRNYHYTEEEHRYLSR